MSRPVVFLLVLVFTLISSTIVCAQDDKKDKVELLHANSLKSGLYKGHKVNRVIGDVKLRHGETMMYCDSAIKFREKDYTEAYGHVRIIKNDTTQLFGDSLFYDGENDFAKVRGNVKLIDQGTTLWTEFLDYNMATDVASYFNGGKMKDEGSTLTSKKGAFMLSSSRVYVFSDSVVLFSDKKDTLYTDSLRYYNDSKDAFFYGPSTILTNDGKEIHADKGQYNMETEIAAFEVNAVAKSKDQTIYGDSLYFDNKADYSYAFGHVKLVSEEDSTLINGKEAFRWGDQFKTVVIGHPVMRKAWGKDTLLLTADTLVSINDTVNEYEVIKSYYNARFYKRDMQGLCDSLTYQMTDSVIYLNGDPMLWNEQNQITGDTIHLTMKNEKVDRMFVDENAMMIALDTLNDYNQVKGRNMEAVFKHDEIDVIYVTGNGESIYFARNDDEELVGMNKVVCSNIVVDLDSGDVQTISFVYEPKAHFIPPHEISQYGRELEGFQWKVELRPQRQDFYDLIDKNTRLYTKNEIIERFEEFQSDDPPIIKDVDIQKP